MMSCVKNQEAIIAMFKADSSSEKRPVCGKPKVSKAFGNKEACLYLFDFDLCKHMALEISSG
jgi:hypothetical protein